VYYSTCVSHCQWSVMHAGNLLAVTMAAWIGRQMVITAKLTAAMCNCSCCWMCSLAAVVLLCQEDAWRAGTWEEKTAEFTHTSRLAPVSRHVCQSHPSSHTPAALHQ